MVLVGEHVVFDKAESVTSQVIVRNLGVKKLIAPELYWVLSVVWDGKEYKRDPNKRAWNGPWEIIPKTAWRTGFSLSEYLVPADLLTAGRHTIALNDAFAESNTLTVFIEKARHSGESWKQVGGETGMARQNASVATADCAETASRQISLGVREGCR